MTDFEKWIAGLKCTQLSLWEKVYGKPFAVIEGVAWHGLGDGLATRARWPVRDAVVDGVHTPVARGYQSCAQMLRAYCWSAR